MSDVKEKLEHLPPRLKRVGLKLLNWIEHTNWEHGHHADEALLALTEEVIRLRAHLGVREQYLLDETALHPNLPAPSVQQFGHAIHADTCPMCADDAKAFEHLRKSGERSEAGRVAYVQGVSEVEQALIAIQQREKLGAPVPSTTELTKTLLKALNKLGEQARRAWSK